MTNLHDQLAGDGARSEAHSALRAGDVPMEMTGGGWPEGPQIYAACLASYNSGILHGCWIDAAQEPEELRAAVSAMLTASPIPQAEEFAIHDYQGFGSAPIGEYTGLDEVAALAQFIDEHGEDLGGALLEHFGGDLEAARAAFDDYAGSFRSLADFMEELTEDCGEQIPERLAPYIDYEAMGRDAELSGDVFTIEISFEDVHVFWSR
ncbi:MAG: antirestriction protein ArdA [Pseudomonadota bacterium]